MNLIKFMSGMGGNDARTARVLRWQTRAALDRLDDAKPGPAEALHALLPWECDAIITVTEQWLGIDRSHRPWHGIRGRRRLSPHLGKQPLHRRLG